MTKPIISAALMALLLTACGGSSSGKSNSSINPTPSSSSTSSVVSSQAQSSDQQSSQPVSSTPVESSSSSPNVSSSSLDQTSSTPSSSSVASVATSSSQPVPSSSSSHSLSSIQNSSNSSDAESSQASSEQSQTSSESSASSSSEAPVSLAFHTETFDGATATDFYKTDYLAGGSGQPMYKKSGGNPVFEDGTVSLTGARFTIGETGKDLDLSKPYRISFDVVAVSGSGKKFQIYIDNSGTSGSGRLVNENIETLVPGARFSVDGNLGTTASYIQIRMESGATLVLDNLLIEYVEGTGSSSSSSSAGTSSSTGNSSSSGGVSSSSSVSSAVSSTPVIIPPAIPPGTGGLSTACYQLATDPNTNWRETSLQTDQEIVKCLSDSLGKPIGYGEHARGGYDPNGNSKLTVIVKNHPDGKTVEEQINEAIADNAHNWIVFDKIDFAQSYEIGLYRLHCANPQIASILNITESQCNDYRQWCSDNNITGEARCLDEFFNKKLNNNNLLFMRNPVIGSNKTIDGRMSEAHFLFYGFMIGRDSAGVSTQKSTSVILTHLNFKGAGHTEDHYIDPDMIRNTGESQDIWIHKNTFDLTGDSAFDVKVGAYNITMSFNKIIDVKRAALHGSSDSRTINAQITTTMHHNAFITRDNFYSITRNTGRRAPLLRRGTSHMFNNLFFNYRKEISSIRVGAQILWEDNAIVVNRANMEKSTVESSMTELLGSLIDFRAGSFRAQGVHLWYSDANCNLDETTRHTVTESHGSVSDLTLAYTPASQTVIANQRIGAGQELVDYVSATAGKHGQLPFNSPLAGNLGFVLNQGKASCQ